MTFLAALTSQLSYHRNIDFWDLSNSLQMQMIVAFNLLPSTMTFYVFSITAFLSVHHTVLYLYVSCIYISFLSVELILYSHFCRS